LEGRTIKIIAPILWIIGIILSLFAIFKIVGNADLAVGLIIISFGILSVIWTSIANKSLSKGSELRKFTGKFLFCAIFVLLYAVWSILDGLFNWEGILVYFGYSFLTITFFMFVFAAYHILAIGKKFGFETQATKINKAVEEKKNKKIKNFL
jgi:hypothetical protein